jgi:3D (Asp-Asp-Asp) domain-containing protein
MKTKFFFVAGFISVGLFTITVHENQVEIITQQEAHIRSLETELESRDQLVSELNKTLERRSSELTEAKKRIEELEERVDSLIQLEATAYTPFCDTGCIGITTGGTNVAHSPYKDGKRVVAVDPDIIPLGTEMTVHTSSGSFTAIADDTGGDIQGHRLDVLVMTETKAKKFGRQEVTVELH